jgi:transposase
MDIILGKERRRWSEDDKRAIVAETLAAGEVTSVARRHGANPSMVFSWRKRLLDESRPSERPPAFMPVILPPPETQSCNPPAVASSGAATLDVEFSCGARLRVTGAVDPDLVAGVVRALRRA